MKRKSPAAARTPPAPRVPVSRPSKKSRILAEAAAFGFSRFGPADISEIRRRLAADSTIASEESIAAVLEDAGHSLARSARSDTGGRFDDEFRHLLRFATLAEAERCLARLGILLGRFRSAGEHAAVERVIETARLGRQRAERIARNLSVAAPKRAEKTEIAQWFRVWLELPEAFAGWLELRKESAEFRERFETTEDRR